MYIYIFLCIYIYIYICIYIYVYVYIYIYIVGGGRDALCRAVPSLVMKSVSKPGGGNVTDRESNPRPLGASSGDSTTHLKRSAVLSGTGIHRLIYRDICVERGASYAACCSQQSVSLRNT